MLRLNVLPQVWLGENGPKVRPFDCEPDGERCCLRIDCKFHLLDGRGAGRVVSDGGRRIDPDSRPGRKSKDRVIGVTLQTLEEFCAIDVAETGPKDRGTIGRLLGISREMVRILERRAIRKIQAAHPDAQGANIETHWGR
jgi:hypothetical protein